MRHSFFLFLFVVLSFSTVQAQPMVVYSVGSQLFIGDGSAGSFTGTEQGSGAIGDLAIDPATRMIYYFDLDNGTIRAAASDGTPMGVISSTPDSPFIMRISQGVLYWSDQNLSPNIRTINLSDFSEGSLPLSDPVRFFNLDTVNSKVVYTTFSEEFIKTANFDGSEVRQITRPTTASTSIEIYGETLLRASFGTLGLITQFSLPAVSSLGTVRASGRDGGIPNDMAADFTNGVYYFLDTGTTPGTEGLYQRSIDNTGYTDQTLIADTSALTPGGQGGLDVLEAERIVLRPDLPITQPPTVIATTENSVTLKLIEFSDIATVLTAASQKALASKNTFRYDVRINPTEGTKAKRKKILTAKDTVTIKRLKPGTYSATYRATIFKKKSKKQVTKGKARGKKGFALKFKKQGSTTFSPEATFTITK